MGTAVFVGVAVGDAVVVIVAVGKTGIGVAMAVVIGVGVASGKSGCPQPTIKLAANIKIRMVQNEKC